MTNHITLLGDSVFDNGVYVETGQDDVTAHLRRKLAPLGWTFENRAVDGRVAEDIECQLLSSYVIKPCTFVLSVGGNDALGHLGMIQDPASDKSAGAVLMAFHQIREDFRRVYVDTLDKTLAYEQPLIVCTIYNPKFPDPALQTLAETGLSFFNDVIVEEALKRNLPIIDLREVCSEREAFANPIEPSEIGGDLITNAIISIARSQQVRRMWQNLRVEMWEQFHEEFKITNDEINGFCRNTAA
jgi:hypothetical protein